jgi:hypothetical protein
MNNVERVVIIEFQGGIKLGIAISWNTPVEFQIEGVDLFLDDGDGVFGIRIDEIVESLNIKDKIHAMALFAMSDKSEEPRIREPRSTH